MSSISAELPVPGREAQTARLSRRRKRFIVLAVTMLGILGAAMGISFTADTGTATATVEGSQEGSSGLVYTSGASLPAPSGVTGIAWKVGDASATAPVLSYPAVGSNGTVKTAGDLAFVDASTAATAAGGHIIVSAYMTNAATFATLYPTFSLPVELYCATATGSGPYTFAWSGAANQVTGGSYLTGSGPSLSWSVAVAANEYCEVTMDTGGSYYAATSGTPSAPSIYVTAQRSG